jgi:hypothetical protein
VSMGVYPSEGRLQPLPRTRGGVITTSGCIIHLSTFWINRLHVQLSSVWFFTSELGDPREGFGASICPASPFCAALSTIVASLNRLPSTASIAARLVLGLHEDDFQAGTLERYSSSISSNEWPTC